MNILVGIVVEVISTVAMAERQRYGGFLWGFHSAPGFYVFFFFFSGNAIYKWMRTGGIPIEDWKYLEKVYADLPVGTHAHTQLWKTTHV